MRLIKIIIPCLLLTGCLFGTSKNAKFYTPSAVSTEALSTDYAAFIGVSRIQLPKYMDRPQIVTQQKDSSQVHISEYNRWVEFPSVLITRVLIEDLSVLLPAAHIKMNHLRADRFDRTVLLEISEMNGVLGVQATLSAWYTIKDKTGKVLTQQKFTGTVPVGKSYDDLVKGYSQLLAQLGQDVASVLLKE